MPSWGNANEPKVSLLANAIETKDWRLANDLLKTGTNPNALQADWMTALHWATFHGNQSLAEQLLDAGAKVDATTRYGIRPLAIACQHGHEKIAAALLAAGADANAIMPGKITPLMLAARTGDAEIVRQLIKHNAKLDTQQRHGQTALMWAASAGNLAAVDALITAGADLNLASKTGFTAMLFAAREGQSPVAQRLLKAGIDVNAPIKQTGWNERRPRNQMSPLLFAVESGHFELAIELVKAGADPNDQRSGYAPLHALSWVRKANLGDNPTGDPEPRGSGSLSSLDFVRQMVTAGADVNLRLAKGKGGWAHLNHRDASPAMFAALTADLPYLKLLVELGADPLVPNIDGCTPIMACAGVGVRAVGEEAGTEPEVLETVRFLVAQGADVNTIDANQETAMHGAAYRNFPQVVTLLARSGASPAKWNHKNKWGWTPVMIAQGRRPGSVKPSPETVAALQAAMQERKVAQND